MDRQLPEQPEILDLLWNANSGQGDLQNALAAARLQIQLQPKNHVRRLDLIKTLKSQYREVECLDEIRLALEQDPPSRVKSELKFLLIDQLMVLGQIPEAWKEVSELERQSGKSIPLQSKVIDLLRTEGRLDEALAAVTELFPKVQHMPVAYLTRGSIYLDLGHYEKAASDLEKVVAAEPANEGAHFKLSQAYRALQKPELAQQHQQIGTDIRQKRIRIAELTKRQGSSRLNREDYEELSRLNRALGAFDAARYWQQRASYADRK
jgi:tetratricopeptide (TPR) repeat protein